MASYGGYQQGPARIIIDENGQQQVVYDNLEVSPQSQHENVLKTYARTQGQVMDPRKSMLPYLLAYSAWASAIPAASGAGGAAPVSTGISGSGGGSVPAYMSPTGTSTATSTAMGGSTFAPGLGGATVPAGGMTGSAMAGTGFGGPAVAGTAPYYGSAAAPISLAQGGGAAPAGASTPSLGTTPYQGGRLGTDVALRNPQSGMNWEKFMTSYGGKGMMEAVPSLVMGAFMGKDARALSRAQTEQAQAQAEFGRAQLIEQQQRNAYREWMRPMVQQSMQSMWNRLPTHMQGNIPQNFGQLRYPTGA